MTQDESKRLNVGDRVRWGLDPALAGTISKELTHGWTIKWDDGQETNLAHVDMGIAREFIRDYDYENRRMSSADEYGSAPHCYDTEC